MESIFLLEDDQTLGRGIGMALEGPGRAVTLAGTLQESRAILAQNRFDLLILDINLPDGSGWTCCGSCGGPGTTPGDPPHRQ